MQYFGLIFIIIIIHAHRPGGLVDAAVHLMEECDSKMVAITDGAAGSIFATKNNVRHT